jgi:GTPase SAR1 family protein
MENKILKQTFIRLRDENFIVICYIDQSSFSKEEIKELWTELSKKFPNNMIIILPDNYMDLTFTEREDTISLLKNLIKQLEKENDKNEEK